MATSSYIQFTIILSIATYSEDKTSKNLVSSMTSLSDLNSISGSFHLALFLLKYSFTTGE